MDNLRLILILLGALILVGIVVFHNQGKSRKQKRATRREPRVSGSGGAREPVMSDGDSDGEVEQPSLERLDEKADEPADVPEGGRSGRREPVIPDLPDQVSNTGQGSGAGSAGESADPSEKIVILYLKRKEGKKLSGVELLEAALKAGLVFGEMNIFHRRQEGGEQSVFSMANITNPGTFDPTAWNLFETPGVTLFLTLPGPISGLDAWDAMLATGQRLAELLNAELLDDSQCLLTRQRIAQIREEMREYDRKQGIGASGGS